MIPPAWQYPDITCARIIFEDLEFKTDQFIKTRWKQSAKIEAYEKKTGIVEVYYIEKRPELDEGPFLKEERSLIQAISKLLGEITKRKQVEKSLRESELQLLEQKKGAKCRK